MQSTRSILLVAAAILIGGIGCSKSNTTDKPAGQATKTTKPAGRPVTRPAARTEKPMSVLEFNQAAVRLNLGLMWVEDRNGNKRPDPEEVVSLLFYPKAGPWVQNGAFTKEYRDAVSAMRVDHTKKRFSQNARENVRIGLVREDLDQGRPTLAAWSSKAFTKQDKAFMNHMVKVAHLIDQLYAKELGIDGLDSKIQASDTASKSLFRRNWGPDCKGPRTEKNPQCTAIAGLHKPPVGVYPKAMQKDASFCKKLAKLPGHKALMNPFTLVEMDKAKAKAVPFNKAYESLMTQVAKELEAAAASFGPNQEKALVAYLKAAAKSFQTNDWNPADEAWAKMNMHNSKWYLRVAPDEVYWDPCGLKAGFHLTLARINPKSLVWQQKLIPIRQKMEDTLAKLIGAPYKARKVSFHLPDFIDIVVNAGDDRDPFGATIGQSLPNWGPVANQGRGRTVAMVNLYSDSQSFDIQQKLAASILSKETYALYHRPTQPSVMGTILHEATHNMGPAHEYKVKGKTAPEIFGGPLASTLEELKAQTGAMYFVPMLVADKLVTKQAADDSYIGDFLWMLGHISRGMYSGTGQVKPYSHLSAIQLGFFMDEGAITFDPNALAANGKDKGCFTIHMDKLPAAVVKLMKLVGRIKATGDQAGAKKLVEKYVKGTVVPFALIKERVLRSPKASFVYSLDQ